MIEGTTSRTLATLLLLTAAGAAQTPTLLADLNLEPAEERSSWPGGYQVVGSRAWFLATARATGQELYRTDGSAAGTALVLDLEPGPTSGEYLSAVTGWGSGVVFAARHSELGPQLWYDDGGTTPARPLLEVAAATGLHDLGQVVTLGAALLFVADTAAFGREWWITDGTGPGTRLVADLQTGPFGSYPIEVAPLGGGVFFVADRVGTGREPWFTDGTNAGTVLLADVIPGGGSSDARVLASFGGHVLFQHDVAIPAVPRIWITDGTPSGTRPLAANPTSALLGSAVALGTGIVFVGADAGHGRELWFTDGTVAGTRQVVDLTPGPASSDLWPIGGLASGHVLVRVQDPGREGLWSTDGTAAGTQRIATVSPWASRGVEQNGALLFRADDGRSGQELWRSDGTTAGTVLVRDILPGTAGSSPDGLTRLGGETLFTPLSLHLAAAAGLGGVEPWVTDGTAAGTRRLVDVNAVPPGATASSFPIDAIDWNGRAAFLARLGPSVTIQHDLMVSAGTAASTAVHARFPGADPLSGALNERGDPRLYSVAGRLLVITDEPNGQHRLWLDGGSGPVGGPILTLLPDWRAPLAHAVVGDVAWLGGNPLWHVRGPIATPAPLPGSFGYVTDLTVVGEAVLFVEFAGNDLWRCNTDRSCVPLLTASPCPSCWIGAPIAVRDRAFFVQADQTHGIEVRSTDGTPTGTRVLDLVPGPAHFAPRLLAASGDGCLLQFDAGPVVGRLAWTDGTLLGTMLLDAFPSGMVVGRIDEVLPLGRDGFAFVLDDGVHGRELWRIDGAGARLVLDLRAGWRGSEPILLGAVGDEIYFTASSPERGLWRTDGTAAGTVELRRLLGEPTVFTAAGGLVYFDDEDLTHGVEPFVVTAGATAQPIGSGCGVGLRTPWLQTGDPVLGGRWWLRGGGGPAGAFGVVAVGAPRAMPTVHVGGCVEWVDLTTAIVLLDVPDAGTDWRHSFPLPADPTLIGRSVMTQSWCGPSTNSLGFEASGGVRLHFGTW
jgi:ELWxxDGT repeat protein